MDGVDMVFSVAVGARFVSTSEIDVPTHGKTELPNGQAKFLSA
jgi:hypothetical protein